MIWPDIIIAICCVFLIGCAFALVGWRFYR
jgi:hypothetical protein